MSDSSESYLLVVTGYLAQETRQMLALVAAADSSGALAKFAGILIKPHPFLPVIDILRQFSFTSEIAIVDTPLNELTQKSGFAFVANSTAAIFDTLAAGVASAVCAPDNDFNFSPAVEMKAVPMIFDAPGLILALQNPAHTIDGLPDFCTDPALPRWAALLEGKQEFMANNSVTSSKRRGAL